MGIHAKYRRLVSAMLQVVRVPVLADNYVWLLHDEFSRETVVIDPAVAEPVLDAAGSITTVSLLNSSCSSQT